MAGRVLLILAAVVQVGVGPPAQPVALRLHHLHYLVDDPSTAMRALRGRVDTGPQILQGLGVGVGAGAEYLLFDRPPGEAAAPVPLQPAASAAAAAIRRAVRALAGAGFAVSAPEARVDALTSLGDAWSLDHVAFAVDLMAGAVAILERRGIQVTTRHDASVLFRLGRGEAEVTIELVRDPNAPDRFGCPMHPEVRSPVEGACPICRMTLIPIPPMRIGQYGLAVRPTPARTGAGAAGLRVTVTAPESAEVVRAFTPVHEKLLHLFVVSRDLDRFVHLHPEPQSDGTFDVRHELAAGEYLVVADFLPTGGAPQTVQRAVITPGFTPRAIAADAVALQPGPDAVVLDGTRIRLEADVSAGAGREARLRFVVTDPASGAPVTDLEPYLAAPAHVLLVSADLTYAAHGHPADAAVAATAQVGSQIEVEVPLPFPGAYKLWVQVQRKGQVLTAPFVLIVR